MSEPTSNLPGSAGTDLTAENATLRERVAELENELAVVQSDAAKTVASAQETLYWFERWGVDFNSLMARPQVELLRKTLRAVRGVYRRLLKAKRRIIK